MKLLLHICCGPCALFPLESLREAGHAVAGTFYNPNIHPYREYALRRDTLAAYASASGLAVFWDEGYAMEDFLRRVANQPGERCRTCYALRLGHTARLARSLGMDGFTTTLLYSRYQKHEQIRQLAAAAAREWNIPFYYQDFREGWSEGIRASRILGMYRQPYCGCIYSEKERFFPKQVRSRDAADAGPVRPGCGGADQGQALEEDPCRK